MKPPAPQKACSPQPLAELPSRAAAPECLDRVPEGKKFPRAHPAQLRHQRIAVDAPLAIEPLKPYRLRLELSLNQRQIPLQELPRPQGELSLAFQVLDICF